MKDVNVKKVIKGGLIFALITLFAACKKDVGEELLPQIGVDVDVIEFPYTTFEQEFTVKANARWTASVSDESWLSLSQTEGAITDGTPEKISVQVTRNTGPTREAKVTVIMEGQEDIEISVIQAEGFLLLGNASVKGILKQDRDMNETNEISIPYTRGGGNQTVSVSVTASGDGAVGLMPIEDMVFSATSAQGTLSVPISGRPLNQGDVEFVVTVSNGMTYSIPAQVFGSVGETYYDQKFNLMQWGGDYMNKQDGVKGEFEGRAEKDVDGKDAIIYYEDKTKPVVSVGYLEVGSPNFFHLSRDYRASRGAPSPRGLGGSGMFERPGYLQVGDGVLPHSLITQQIWTIPPSQTRKVRVSVDLARWEGASSLVKLARFAGGGTLSDTQLVVENEFEWKTYVFFIDGATSLTRIRFQTTTNAEGEDGRFFIRNILVQEVLE